MNSAAATAPPAGAGDAAGLRAVAALALTGRYSGPGRQAADGLHAWAADRRVDLHVEDDRSDPDRTESIYRRLARSGADLLFGPYGSGPTRAAVNALAGEPAVLWNHGGAASDAAESRVVSVIAPAERYWAGLADVLAGDGVPLDRVAVLNAPTGFGRATAAGAVASLRAAGARPLMARDFDEETASAAADEATAAGARAVVGCGRIEDDLALGRALTGRGLAVGLIVCGVGLAAETLGDDIAGWIGPAAWWPDGPAPPVALPAGSDYPAAQALAAGLVAERALHRAGTTEAAALWDAARDLRTETFLGPFAVDDRGRQTALAPFLVRWEARDGRPARVPAWRPPTDAPG